MSTISASTTSTTAYKVTADTTGALVLQTGATPTTALTIDASQNVSLAKGLTVGATAAPAFSAYSASGTAMSNGAYVKVTFDTERFDTNSNYASSRFTPTVAGLYQVNSHLVYLTTSTVTHVVLALYKNGAVETYTNFVTGVNTGSSINLSYIISMNGTTDYIEMYLYMAGAGTLSAQGGVQTTFNAAMIRNA